jgi:lysophospholipase L1-like esterase
VLGDSLSAGVGREERCWPAVLAGTSGLPVVNLARPGATVRSAMDQAEAIAKSDSVVILEVGGNDLLHGTEAADYRRGLDALLSRLRAGRHEVLMFELPLPPFANAFGAAQRDAAAEHDARLIPKRVLAGVLGMKGGTVDGLHLSQKGHDALAERMAGIVRSDE